MPPTRSGTSVEPQWTSRAGRSVRSVKVFEDERTGRMDWISVTTGLFGLRDNYAPLIGSRVEGDNVVLLVDKELVKNSPNSATTDDLTPEEREALTTYYLPFLR